LVIFHHHAKAWHTAALIYYYRRIQHYNVEELMQEVEHVAEDIHTVENLKFRCKYDRGSRMAPITWPAFIFPYDAIRRDPWKKW
jgi:arginine metabolism regulation protein II